MNIREAKYVVKQLTPHLGHEMKPFNTPVKGFVIVPREKQAYDTMLQIMQEMKSSFDDAIQPYKEDVTILVYFDAADTANVLCCPYSQFLSSNGIKLPTV